MKAGSKIKVTFPRNQSIELTVIQVPAGIPGDSVYQFLNMATWNVALYGIRIPKVPGNELTVDRIRRYLHAAELETLLQPSDVRNTGIINRCQMTQVEIDHHLSQITVAEINPINPTKPKATKPGKEAK